MVDLIKGQRIQLIVNTPTGLEPWFDEKAIRRAAGNRAHPDDPRRWPLHGRGGRHCGAPARGSECVEKPSSIFTQRAL